jgi:uncharacterized protein (TIGR02466 family)
MEGTLLFPTAVYKANKSEWVEKALEAAKDAMHRAGDHATLDDLYPVKMSDNFFDDERVRELSDFIGQSCWSIMNDQGYMMDRYILHFSEMWMQEHSRNSYMEHHVHGRGAVMVGFFFLETPENCSDIVLSDPRTGKVQSDLEVKRDETPPLAAAHLIMKPQVGDLYITNSWLPHGFTRHNADEPIRFIHFTMVAFPASMQPNDVEIV